MTYGAPGDDAKGRSVRKILRGRTDAGIMTWSQAGHSQRARDLPSIDAISPRISCTSKSARSGSVIFVDRPDLDSVCESDGWCARVGGRKREMKA